MKKCDVCNKTEYETKVYKGERYGYNYLCRRHYLQLNRHGKIYDRTIYDSNEYIERVDDYEIKLFSRNQEHVASAYIDKIHIDKVRSLKWYLKKSNGSIGYCVTKGLNKNSPVSIQDFILDNLDSNYSPINKYDHIDNNGLNNLESNLRLVTSQQNSMNMSKKSTNTSGVTGVKIYKADKNIKWDATITYKYNDIWLGRSELLDDAVKLRFKAESEHFKEYSPNYNPTTNTLQLTYISKDDNTKTFIEADLQGNIINFTKIIS